MKNILIIQEDDEETNFIKQFFELQKTKVLCAHTVSEAVDYFVSTDLCLIILDANLSVEDDHKLLKAMRQAKATPILVLSSKTDHKERLSSLRAGAHAYMGKPYTLEECLAQSQSLIQMYVDLHPDIKDCFTLVCGKDLIIDPERRQVFLKGKAVPFTRKEFDILFCLASNPGKVFTREQLYDNLWDEESAFNVDDVVKAHIKALRKKLSDADMEYIKNVWGVGYRFHHDEE